MAGSIAKEKHLIAKLSYFAFAGQQTSSDMKKRWPPFLSNEAIEVGYDVDELPEKADEICTSYNTLHAKYIGMRELPSDNAHGAFLAGFPGDCLSVSLRPRMDGITASHLPSAQSGSCRIVVDEHQPKRMKTSPAVNAFVHKACCDPRVSVDDLAQLLLQDPFAISRPIELKSCKEVYNPNSGKLEQRTVPEAYSYPLNLAIDHGASFDVIEMLVTADPSVLLKKDGPQGETSLLILLKRSSTSYRRVALLLLSDPRCALETDRHQNTALHVACFSGASLMTVQHLCMVNRDALAMRNFHGRTPLQVAQTRISSCSDDVVEFLWFLSEA